MSDEPITTDQTGDAALVTIDGQRFRVVPAPPPPSPSMTTFHAAHKPPPDDIEAMPRQARSPVDVELAFVLAGLLRWPVLRLWYVDRTYLWCRRKIVWLWRQARSFAYAHADGFVSVPELARREAACDGCQARGSHAGHWYCVPSVATCNCPKNRWWPFTWLTWKQSMRTFACPLGHFDSVPWQHFGLPIGRF